MPVPYEPTATLAQTGGDGSIAQVYAQYSSLILLLLMFVLFYFLLIRPQQKRQKERERMLAALKKGDRVVTIGGLHGTIVDLDDKTVVLRAGDSRLTFERSAISAVLRDDKGEK
ncbi:preprotein translocase subunit YajC [Brockia lithotrophica]|uniref:preprotein translocase subunit YajC n=1 Tax=Brockia lithotrophica TaxID=933949 RepID=UPI000EB1F3B3|nr:preprotein translocase subunit YajC [Brockia lithotrophica]